MGVKFFTSSSLCACAESCGGRAEGECSRAGATAWFTACLRRKDPGAVRCSAPTASVFLSLPSAQLQHTLTGKYVRVNSTLTSRTENTSLRVELSGENSNSCVFKILPRYKVRSVGDVVSPAVGCAYHELCKTLKTGFQVRYQDQIKFESVMIEGQYLHCSMRPYGSVGFYVFEHW